MEDIVKRLREWIPCQGCTDRMAMEAADEIARLRKALTEIRDREDLTGAECMAIATAVLKDNPT